MSLFHPQFFQALRVYYDHLRCHEPFYHQIGKSSWCRLFDSFSVVLLESPSMISFICVVLSRQIIEISAVMSRIPGCITSNLRLVVARSQPSPNPPRHCGALASVSFRSGYSVSDGNYGTTAGEFACTKLRK